MLKTTSISFTSLVRVSELKITYFFCPVKGKVHFSEKFLFFLLHFLNAYDILGLTNGGEFRCLPLQNASKGLWRRPK